ncbi:LppU/SCO3897 family protein, partial [Paractinoplanes deccanensis]
PGYAPQRQPGHAPQGQPGYAPQGQPGYAPQGQPGFAPQGQPAGAQPGEAGYTPPAGAQPGFPPPNAGGFPPPGGGEAPQGFGTFPQEKKKGGAGKLVLRIGGAILVALVIAGLKFGIGSALFGDKAKDAKAGDCISSGKEVKAEGTTETDADVVDCTSADAKFTVVARVDGESNPDSKSCDKYFKEGEEFYVFGSTSGSGYLLCLRPKA